MDINGWIGIANAIGFKIRIRGGDIPIPPLVISDVLLMEDGGIFYTEDSNNYLMLEKNVNTSVFENADI